MTTKIIKLYTIISFFISFAQSLAFATYVVFLTSKGMDLMQVNIINAVFMASVFLFEIPTGALADLFGRKRSIVMGCFVLALADLVYFTSGTFWFFVLAEIIAAVSLTLFSGAKDAWLVDLLKFHNFNGDFKKVFRRGSHFQQIGIILGSLSGAYLGNINIAFPWLATAISIFIIGLFLQVVMKEDYFIRQERGWIFKPILQIAKDSVHYGYKNKAVWYIVLLSLVFTFSVQAFNMQWQIVFKGSYNLPVKSLGWIFVGISIAVMIGNHFSVAFARFIKKEKEAIILSQGITALGMILASLMFPLAPMMAVFLLHEAGRGMVVPLTQDYLSHRIPSEKRATILSFKSMIGKIGAFGGLLVSGYLANTYSISLAWMVSGAVLGLSIPIFLRIKNGEST